MLAGCVKSDDDASSAATTTRADGTIRRPSVSTCRAVVFSVSAVTGGRASDATLSTTRAALRLAAVPVDRPVSVYHAAVSRRTSVCATGRTSVVSVRCPCDAAVPLSVSTVPRARGSTRCPQVGHHAAVRLASKVRTASVESSRAATSRAVTEDCVSWLTPVPGSCASVGRRTPGDTVKDDRAPLTAVAVAPIRLCSSTSVETVRATTTTTVSTAVRAS